MSTKSQLRHKVPLLDADAQHLRLSELLGTTYECVMGNLVHTSTYSGNNNSIYGESLSISLQSYKISNIYRQATLGNVSGGQSLASTSVMDKSLCFEVG